MSLAPETLPDAPGPNVQDGAHGRPLFRSLPGEPVRDYFLLAPPGAGPTSPVLVLVHGISENALAHVLRFADEANRRGIVLIAPLFRKSVYGRYQQVVDSKRGIRADTALLDMLEAVRRDFGFFTEKVWLSGFSGGAQFVHRFALIHPERVRGCASVAAGWYTFPDPALPYPYGLATHPIPGRNFDADAIRQVPFHVIVGDRDSARDPSLHKNEKLDALQGMNRIERAERWFAAMQAWGCHPDSTLTLLPGARHCFSNAVLRRGLDRTVVAQLGLARA